MEGYEVLNTQKLKRILKSLQSYKKSGASREMDLLISCMLCILFTMALVKTFYVVAGGSKTSSGRLPPGPVALPIVGNLLQLGDKPHKSLAKLAKIHGPIMSLKLGKVTAVIFSSATMAKEVLQKHDIAFANRTVCLVDAVRVHEHEDAGLPWLPISPAWRIHRKVCNSYIFSGQRLDASQEIRQKKVQELLVFVEESCCSGKPIDIGQAAFSTIVNLLSNTIFSVDLADSDSDIARMFKRVVNGIMEEAGKPNLSDYFPLLRKIDPQGIRRRMTLYFGKILELFDQMIKDRSRLRKEPDFISSNDVLDTLLDICERNSEDFDRSHIEHLFLVLFVAGTDTTSSTLEWAMAELLRNPEALFRARAELEQTIGKGNRVQESDVARLPYLQAIIKETFRLHAAVPLLLPRKAAEDVEVAGYKVPKDAQVMVNAWAIGRDPSIWEDSNSFVPERFLRSEIDARGQHFELIPFGAGRRVCPGLPLAIHMLHLMLGSLIHSFDWKLEDGVTPETMNMEDKFGLTLQKAQPLRAIPIPK
ncbi:LOW QUALITY PROTEIN: geraniol 8-hydroxylase-like [Tripterygium wilfordii]|nr:LOW QUALITY PROTEIN: geraniol 8-hydroxylase-like [Tripterygium wilfordii]